MHLSCGTGATRRDVVFAPLPRRVRVRTSERRIAFLLGRAARDWKGKTERRKKARARGSKNMAADFSVFVAINLKRVYRLEVFDCWISVWSGIVYYKVMAQCADRRSAG